MLSSFVVAQARRQKVGEKPLLSVSTFVQVGVLQISIIAILAVWLPYTSIFIIEYISRINDSTSYFFFSFVYSIYLILVCGFSSLG